MEDYFPKLANLTKLNEKNSDFNKREDIELQADTTSYSDNPVPILLIVEKIIKNSNLCLNSLKSHSENFVSSLNINSQDCDDLAFYKGLIEGSLNYHSKLLKTKIRKIIHDLNILLSNSLFKKSDTMKVTEFDDKCCQNIQKKFSELVSKTDQESNSKEKPIWIKNNQLEQLQNLKEEMNRIFMYHYETNKYFLESLVREVIFFNVFP